MTSLRQFRAEDLFRTSLTNLDPLTENYDYGFYDQYLTEWPELFTVAEDIDGNVIGYSKSSFFFPQICSPFQPPLLLSAYLASYQRRLLHLRICQMPNASYL